MKPLRRRPLHRALTRHAPAAIGLALSTLAAQAQTSSFVGLGTGAGTDSDARAINDSGQVIGTLYDGDYTTTSAFVYSGGVMTGLTGLGGRQTYAAAISNSGQIVGQARTADNTQLHAVVYAGGAAQDINPPFGARGSTATGVNGSGQVAGWAQTGGSSFSAFVVGSGGVVTPIDSLLAGGRSFAYAINDAGQVAGAMDVLPIGGTNYVHAFIRAADGTVQLPGTLDGPNNDSYAFAINASGAVTGQSGIGGDDASWHAFSFSQGVMTDLGTLGGASSSGNAINASGWIVGNADAADGTSHAVLWMNGQAYDLGTAAPAGWTLTGASGINAAGQIVGSGTHDGHGEAFVLTPKTSWIGASGHWDDGTAWHLGAFGAINRTPGALDDVAIAPAGNATVLGSAAAGVHSLTVIGNTGRIVTFDLDGGTTATGAGTSIGANAVFTGNGELDGPLTVLSGGVLQVNGGQTMLLAGPTTIVGQARVYGGGGTANLNATAPVTIASGGQMNLQGASLDLRAGLVVQGQMNAGAGGNNVAGAVTVAPAALVVLSGNSATSFYDSVEVQSGAEFRVSAGASATFFGAVTQRTGALFTGSGGKYYEGGLSIGASPGFGTDAGNVTFGDGNLYLAEIGGTTACTAACGSNDAVKNSSFDKYAVTGHLALGGTLKLVSWNGFVATAGERFDLLDWGSVSGSFDRIDSGGLQLAAGTALDLSNLYTRGEIDVVPVPEPQAWALMACGLGLLALRRGADRRARADAGVA